MDKTNRPKRGKAIDISKMEISKFEQIAYARNLTVLMYECLDDLEVKGIGFSNNLKTKVRNLKSEFKILSDIFLREFEKNAKETIEMEQKTTEVFLRFISSIPITERIAILQNIDNRPNAQIIKLNNELISAKHNLRLLNDEIALKNEELEYLRRKNNN